MPLRSSALELLLSRAGKSWPSRSRKMSLLADLHRLGLGRRAEAGTADSSSEAGSAISPSSCSAASLRSDAQAYRMAWNVENGRARQPESPVQAKKGTQRTTGMSTATTMPASPRKFLS